VPCALLVIATDDFNYDGFADVVYQDGYANGSLHVMASRGDVVLKGNSTDCTSSLGATAYGSWLGAINASYLPCVFPANTLLSSKNQVP
jgi:hypothetical protein